MVALQYEHDKARLVNDFVLNLLFSVSSYVNDVFKIDMLDSTLYFSI